MRAILEPTTVTGGETPLPVVLGPVLNEVAIQEWKKKDVLARWILLSTIDQKLQGTLVGCKSAHQIWVRLKAQHMKCAANNCHAFQLKFMNDEYQPGHGQCSISLQLRL